MNQINNFVRVGLFACLMACMLKPVAGQSRKYETDEPRPIPLTRPVLKQLIEDVKYRRPRIPLPEMTEEDRVALKDRTENYEARLRYHYLGQTPRSRGRGFGPRGNADENMSLDYGFKVELFWIVSRTNNCQYCLGHQESKLLSAGRTEDQIAALDCDWAGFTPAEQAAFAFARKYTYEPHLLDSEDVVQLREYFTDLQILEMTLSMSWNNTINRWKEGVGVPQNPDEGGYSRTARSRSAEGTDSESTQLFSGSYLTPTSEKYQRRYSTTAIVPNRFTNEVEVITPSARRPKLESVSEVKKALRDVRTRTSQLPLVDVETARQVFRLQPDASVENWMRLMANFPSDGLFRRGQALFEALNDESLDPVLRAQIQWIVGRQDRAWYVVARGTERLQELGQSDQAIFALDGSWEDLDEGRKSLLTLAKNLATSPVVLTDDQVSAAVESVGPEQTVRVIQLVTQLAALTRMSKLAALPLESSSRLKL